MKLSLIILKTLFLFSLIFINYFVSTTSCYGGRNNDIAIIYNEIVERKDISSDWKSWDSYLKDMNLSFWVGLKLCELGEDIFHFFPSSSLKSYYKDIDVKEQSIISRDFVRNIYFHMSGFNYSQDYCKLFSLPWLENPSLVFSRDVLFPFLCDSRNNSLYGVDLAMSYKLAINIGGGFDNIPFSKEPLVYFADIWQAASYALKTSSFPKKNRNILIIDLNDVRGDSICPEFIQRISEKHVWVMQVFYHSLCFSYETGYDVGSYLEEEKLFKSASSRLYDYCWYRVSEVCPFFRLALFPAVSNSSYLKVLKEKLCFLLDECNPFLVIFNSGFCFSPSGNEYDDLFVRRGMIVLREVVKKRNIPLLILMGGLMRMDLDRIVFFIRQLALSLNCSEKPVAEIS